MIEYDSLTGWGWGGVDLLVYFIYCTLVIYERLRREIFLEFTFYNSIRTFPFVKG